LPGKYLQIFPCIFLLTNAERPYIIK
jgi:hypothetical protein